MLGTPDQDPMKGFSDVEAEQLVNVEMRFNNPVVRSIEDTNCTSVRVTIQTPALATTNTANGNITGAAFRHKIEISPIGGTYVTKINDVISGKTTSQYARSYLIALDPSATG
ncbi:hypothetical protein GP486_008968, partial [Trichoglossum hirsutum]